MIFIELREIYGESMTVNAPILAISNLSNSKGPTLLCE